MKTKKPRSMSNKNYKIIPCEEGIWFDMISYKNNGDRVSEGFIIKKDKIGKLMRFLIDYTKWVESDE